jgi:hypothetical protein
MCFVQRSEEFPKIYTFTSSPPCSISGTGEKEETQLTDPE